MIVLNSDFDNWKKKQVLFGQLCPSSRVSLCEYLFVLK